jgi:hypothetical protein
MFPEKTTFDLLVHFLGAAKFELGVMAFCVMLGVFWTRDYDDFDDLNVVHQFLRSFGTSGVPRVVQFVIGAVGWGWIFVHYGSSTGRYYDSEIRTVVYSFAVFAAIPLDMWVRIFVFAVLPGMISLVEKTVDATIDLIDVTLRFTRHISRKLVKVGRKFKAFRDGVNSTSNLPAFLSANTILLVGGASVGAIIGMTFFETVWDIQTVNALSQSGVLLLAMASLTLVCARTTSVVESLDITFGTGLSKLYQAFLTPIQKPFLDASSFVDGQIRGHQERQIIVRELKAKALRRTQKEVDRPELVLVPLEPVNKADQPMSGKWKINKAAAKGLPVSSKRNSMASLSSQTDLFAEPWDGDPMTLAAYIEVTYPNRKTTHAVLLALAAHARRLENET